MAEFYAVNGMVLESRKRREHLTEEDLQKNRYRNQCCGFGSGRIRIFLPDPHPRVRVRVRVRIYISSLQKVIQQS
jgi:hypothetical protein